MLQITNLYAGYQNFDVLKGVNITVKEKEIVALIGPNGAGKSTVIKSLYHLAKVKSGTIEYKGKNIQHLSNIELLNTGICYINQGKVIFSSMTVKENLEVSARLLTTQEFNKRLTHVYQKFPILKQRANSLAGNLSGGERQQLAFGRALLQKPSLLLLDEPSLGLSPKLQTELFKTIRKLCDEEGMAVLIVEQNAKKAIELADRTYLLEEGKIALEGSGKKLLQNPKIKKVYLGGA